MRSRLREWHVVAPAAALALLLVIARGRPSVFSDSGVFVSVGARILEGDRLYADVYDNKDPLFLYGYAGAMGIAGWRGPFLLDVLWLTIAGSSAALLLRQVTESWSIAAVALVSYPVLLTGYWYATGHSQLAALSLTPLAALLWARGRPFSGGLMVGIAVLFKLVLALVVIAPIVVLAVLRVSPVGSQRRAIIRLCGGLAVALGAAALALAVRGELVPYIRVLEENLHYSNDVLTETRSRGGILGHIDVVRESVRYDAAFVALNVAGILVVGLSVARRGRSAAWASPVSWRLGWLYLGAASATAVTLALTAAWSQHIHMLALPSMLLACLAFSVVLQGSASSLRFLAAVGVATLVLLGFGAHVTNQQDVQPGDYKIPMKAWWSPREHPSTVASIMNDVRTNELAAREHIGYAVLGGNEEQGHAAFADDAYDLECPRFHQYQFSSYLDEVVSCIEDRRPTVVVTTREFRVQPEWSDDWRRFIGQASAVLSKDYVRVRKHPDVAIWIRGSTSTR